MKLNIRNFILLLLTLSGIYFYSIFGYYFYKQEQERKDIIYKDLKTNIVEQSYLLSKKMTSKTDIMETKTIFDRIVASYDFINAILLFDKEKLLINTNPNFDIKTIKSPIHLHKNNINERKYLIEKIRFYEGNKLKNLFLIYVVEENEITSFLNKNKTTFLFYFGILPTLAFIMILLLLKKYISNPLERLRQYVYNNNHMPEPFKIKELESIRHSTIDTLLRLENEKKELYLQARTDLLSGLANRNSLNEFLERTIPTAKRKEKEFAFLFLDIDHFKTINDSLGHDIGDELLKNVSVILKEILRPNDFIARIGGDEFAVIIQDYHNYLELVNIIERIHRQISKAWIVQSHTLNVGCSIGVATYPKNGEDIITLMKNADIAMYEAKKLGRNQYQFFTEKLNKDLQQIIQLSKNMEEALEQNHYELFYQPKIDIETSKIIGCEALIRWNDPQKGMISPNEFIPLAEESGFIIQLGKWIIEETTNQYLKWKEKGIDINISINVSTKQLNDEFFATNLIEILEEKKIEYSKIDIEITEYMVIQESKKTNNNLRKLHETGVSISLDDFGTGYSSLSYLKSLPINNLKIDKSFLDDYNTKEGSIFLETIVKLGQTLDLKVVIEGVETKEQLEYLKDIGCDQYQGYYFSKPLCTSDFEDFYFRIKS